MSGFVFKLPDVGEGIAEVEIVKWHVKAGDRVKEGQALADVMTDKATVEIGAPVSGVVLATSGSEGSKMAVGAELAVFETQGAAAPRAEQQATIAVQTEQSAPLATHKPASGKALASPAVRARAKALNIDLAGLTGSGPAGRIEHADVDRLLSKAAPLSAPPPAIAPAEAGSEDVRIFGLRRRIAERMQDSKRRIPHFTYVEEVDVTELEALRQSLNAESRGRPHLTALPFLIKAIVAAVSRYPAINSQFDDARGIVRRFSAVHAGIATQTARGLLVPVIRNAEAKDLWQIAAEIARLSEEARAEKSKPNELSGSTITVTSLGALGGIMATPIINPPEVAIIGVNRIILRPAIVDGAIVARKLMNLSSSFDHRVIDGHEAAAFIAEARKLLEAPQQLVDAVSGA
jgi:2-oxoisovalerate dehydrogenase E2 component (dihydrolipoyl transacylase)